MNSLQIKKSYRQRAQTVKERKNETPGSESRRMTGPSSPPTLYRSQGAMGLLCGTSEMAKSHWQKNHLPFKSLGVPKSTKRMRDALEKRPTVNVPNFENIYIDRQVNRLVAPNQQDVGQRFVATQSMILAANLTKLL